MQGPIPLYTAEGELQDWIGTQRMARLDGLGLIRIVKHKKGRVSRCILLPRPGDPRPICLLACLRMESVSQQRLYCEGSDPGCESERSTGGPRWPGKIRRDSS